MPFTIYLDDSGTAPSHHVAIASALAIPASRLIALEQEWNRFKAKEGFACFHMAEFAALNPKSEFATWADKQKRVAARVRQIVKKYGAKAFSMSVNKVDYEEVVPDELRKYVGKYHYSWAIANVLAFVEKWATNSKISDHFEYIFDCMGPAKDPKRKEVEDVLDLSESISASQGNPGQYAHYSFRNRCELPALQCADVLAWTCYQHSLLRFRNTPMRPLATAMWNDFSGYRRKEWLWALTIERHNLEDWAKKEIADGRSVKRFQEWMAQQAANKKARGAHGR